VSPSKPLEKLEHPPIVEAVCGVGFAPIDQIDAVLLGAYWDGSRDRFPNHQIFPAILEMSVHVAVGLPPARVWLCNESNTTIVQLQRDRFFLNWRAGDGRYPRFSPPGGVRDQALSEYERFRVWLRDRLAVDLVPSHAEVTKVDHFPWVTTDDLAALLPLLAPTLRMTDGAEPNLLLKLEDGQTRVSIGSAVGADGDRVSRMETTVVCAVSSPAEVATAVGRANDSVNALFARLIPETERTRRFGRTP